MGIGPYATAVSNIGKVNNEETMRDVFNRFYGRYPKDYSELTAFVFDMAVRGLAFTKHSPNALIKKYGS